MPISVTITLSFSDRTEAAKFLNSLPPTESDVHATISPATGQRHATEEAAKAEKKARAKKADKVHEQVVAEDGAAQAAEMKAEEKKAEPAREESTKPPAAIPTPDEIRAAILPAMKAKGQAAVVACLAKFDAKNASTVPEEKRLDCIAALQAMAKVD